jgi:hypothetical protein
MLARTKQTLRTFGSNGATADNTEDQTAYLTAENLGVKVTMRADTGSDYSDTPLISVKNARERGFLLKLEMLPEPIMLNMAIRGESNKQKFITTEILMSAVTITTFSGPFCMRGVRHIIVDEELDHPLIGRPA